MRGLAKVKEIWVRHSVAAPCTVLTLITVLSLLPFLDKAVAMDDTLFLSTTRQIIAGNPKPLDAKINWYGWPMPMWRINKNPPLVSYLIAPVVMLVGFSERALHAAFLLPAVGAVLGTFFIARRLCVHPTLATLLMLFSPAFFVSATTLMSDVPMLCLWVWAIAIWLDADQRGRRWEFVIAGICIAIACLCKYSAIALVPLLAATGITRRHRLTQIISLSIGPIGLIAFDMITMHQYGLGLVRSAFGYSSGYHAAQEMRRVAQLIAGPCFVGGCFLAPAWLMATAASRRTKILIGLFTLLALVALVLWNQQIPLAPDAEPNRGMISAHVLIFGLTGAGMLAAACVEAIRFRDRASLLLALWILGVFVFAAFVNWSANARSILPMAPAIGILAARAIERRPMRHIAAVAIVFSAALSLLLAASDLQIANASRTAASLITTRARQEQIPVWFDGHWGFQWYMDRAGARAMGDATMRRGDLLVEPAYNTNPHTLSEDSVAPIGDIRFGVFPCIATSNFTGGASFYSSGFGPLPFVVASRAPEEFRVYRVTQDVPAPPMPAIAPR